MPELTIVVIYSTMFIEGWLEENDSEIVSWNWLRAGERDSMVTGISGYVSLGTTSGVLWLCSRLGAINHPSTYQIRQIKR